MRRTAFAAVDLENEEQGWILGFTLVPDGGTIPIPHALFEHQNGEISAVPLEDVRFALSPHNEEIY